MNFIKLMAGKLHRVRVTMAEKDYIGSITIDAELLEKANILPLSEVEIVNLSNGNRWSTYALPGVPSSKEICPNGGGALLCKPGDILIIFSYDYIHKDQVYAEGHTAKTLIFDENNNCEMVLEQKILYKNNKIIYESQQTQ